MGVFGPIHGLTPDDIGSIGKQQFGCFTILPGAQQATGMIEVQMGEDHHVDLLMGEALRGEGIEQHMVRLQDAKTRAQLGLKKGADTGLKQEVATALLHQQGTTGERDAIVTVRREPLLPQRPRAVAKHRPAIEALAVTHQRGKGSFAHGHSPIKTVCFPCNSLSLA